MSDLLATGCVYGHYSSLDDPSYDVIRYVGMTGTTNSDAEALEIAEDRLGAHLVDLPEKCGNPEKVAWYRDVEASGGRILVMVLTEMHDVTWRDLGNAEHDWIVKLGGPVIDGNVVQLLNKTWGRDGGWSVDRDEAWREAARQRMFERYATEESRKEHGDSIRQRYVDNPEMRERASEIHREVQNRPERLEQNRQQGLASWQDPEYRAKIQTPTPCNFCGEIFISARTAKHHSNRCRQNPHYVPKSECPDCHAFFLDLDSHIRHCRRNPECVVVIPNGPHPRDVCPECGKECGKGPGLRAHMKWNHTDSPPSPQQNYWACGQCDIVTNGGGMGTHQKTTGHKGKTRADRDAR